VIVFLKFFLSLLHFGAHQDIIKFAGDALLVIWRINTDLDRPVFAAHACECALTIVKEMDAVGGSRTFFFFF
jgi:class 3 adenylate cyclase